MTCEECIHKAICYRVDSVKNDYAQKCGDFVSGCKALKQEPMREFTEEEAKAYSKALDKMYKPTGFNVFNEPCTDAVNREAVKEQMIKYGFHAPDMTVTEFVADLPPVAPQPKTAYWIEHEIEDTTRWVTCSKCNCETHKKFNYCPNCGRRMVEPQERSE